MMSHLSTAPQGAAAAVSVPEPLSARPVASVSFIGLGKLGLPIATCIALAGIPVLAIDRDAGLVGSLEAGAFASSEAGLAEGLASARPFMSFATAIDRVVETDATFLIVPTPSDPETDRFSLAIVEGVVRGICRALVADASRTEHLLVVASTAMPGGVSREIAGLVAAETALRPDLRIALAYAPEFVALGSVMRDFRRPDFVLIGAGERDTFERVTAIYRRIVGPDTPIETMSIAEAEIAKVALNGYICAKISFGNFLAQYASAFGRTSGVAIDAHRIAKAIGHDRRIGGLALAPGMPFGGPCFPRDTRAFQAMAAEAGLVAGHIAAADRINRDHAAWIAGAVAATGASPIGVLGLAFKRGTDVTEESPSWALIDALLAEGRTIVGFDPVAAARDATRRRYGERLRVVDTLEACVAEAASLVIAHPDPAFAVAAASAPAGVPVHDVWRMIPPG